MALEKYARDSGEQSQNGSRSTGQDSRRSRRSNTPRKWQRVLAALLAGRTFNRFEAVRELSDWCLHSTVSTLQAKGITILRKTERVPGYGGLPTDCCRYWLAPESLQRARELLGMPGQSPAYANAPKRS